MIRLILDSAYWGTTSYPLGVINLNKENTDNLNVYPNPSSGILNVSTTNNAPNLQVSIQNAIGEQVMYLPAVNNQIDISQLANGLYMLNAADPQTGKIYHTKVVKVAP
jgi:hypothetical protein